MANGGKPTPAFYLAVGAVVIGLIGFAVWERKNGPGRSVTFPARAYSVNGERRSYTLLRPDSDSQAQDRVRDLILQAYDEFQSKVAVAS